MKIYEHISKQKIDVSENNKDVRMYVCGPTVYNHVHIGNIRPIITFDVLNRLLLFLEYNVKFVHNITDIDDKIIDRAKFENKSEQEITNYYCNKYMEILDKLNINTSNMFFPKVSENILGMEEYISKIINSGFAYLSNGDVYFKTHLISDYGILSNKNIDELKNVNESINVNKENETDFALWKKTNTGLNWKTKFSEGRPGWHTECSYLINKFFGDCCDIHGGGIDLKFPHHENENAQNIAVNSKPISRIWLHVGHLNINDQKMSKSLNNFLLAKDILDKYEPNHVRWFFYQTNYSNPINFTDENLEKSKNNIENIIKNLNQIKSHLILLDKNLDNNFKLEKSTISSFIDDFNFPNLLTTINELLKKSNNLLRNNFDDELLKFYLQIEFILKEILGIKIENIHTLENIEFLRKWDLLKKEKNFMEADKYRKILIERKIL